MAIATHTGSSAIVPKIVVFNKKRKGLFRWQMARFVAVKKKGQDEKIVSHFRHASSVG